MKAPKHIKFQNRQNPRAEFDVVSLEDIATRQALDHSPFQLHLVEFYIILLVHKGKGSHTIDFIEYPLKQGSIITIRKDQIHRFHPPDNIQGTLLLFTDTFLVSYLEQLEALKSLQLFNEALGAPKIQLSLEELSEISSLVTYIQNEYFEVNDEYSQGIIRSELQILIAKLYRIKARSSQSLRQRKYLSEFISFQELVEQMANQTTRVQDYARELGVSTKTLNNITRSIVHQSAKEFIDDICTKQIQRLLINTDLSVKEIAYTSGFEESTNFYKYFKRQTQLTPEQFRVAHR